MAKQEIDQIAENIKRDKLDLNRLQQKQPALESQYRQAEKQYEKTKSDLEENNKEREEIQGRLSRQLQQFKDMQRDIENKLRGIK